MVEPENPARERRSIMNRRTFDTLVSSVGVILMAALVIAGVLFTWGYHFANDNVKQQLTAQRIYFPPKGNEAITSLPAADQAAVAKYAGQQLTNGAQAEAYADHFIAVHLQGIAGGKTYSEVSTLSRANPDNAELATQVQLLFRGETLRGLLLNAFAFWKMGQLAKLGAFAAFILAGIMGIFTILGFWHLRKATPAEQLLVAVPTEMKKVATA
jgi:hypothetical protein